MSKSNYTAQLSAETLAGPYYWSQDIYREEVTRMFYRNWLCVARAEQLTEPGAYVTKQIADENVMLVRGGDGNIRAFRNFCRHRGTRLLEAASGKVARTITCPYHAWTYSLDGRLLSAPRTGRLTGFDKNRYGLFTVNVDEIGGFVFVNIADNPTPLAQSVGGLFSQFKNLPFANLRRAAGQSYEVEANWKIIVENYSECNHCSNVHPTLNRLTPFSTGEDDAYLPGADGSRGLFAGGYMTFAKDYTSMTPTGYTKRKPLAGLSYEDQHRVYYYAIFPNFMLSVQPDYVMTHSIWPISPTRSAVENDFYFEPDAIAAAGFDPSDAVKVWDEINRQDWAVCEGAQRGTRSPKYQGGRYAENETITCDFDRFVQDELRK